MQCPPFATTAPVSPPRAGGLRRITRWVLGVAGSLSIGCGGGTPIPDLIRDVERERVCPAHRIVVRPRGDLDIRTAVCMQMPRWHANLDRDRAGWRERLEPFWQHHDRAVDLRCDEEPPPPEIQADPDRLMIWRKVHDRPFEKLIRDSDRPFQIVEVEACGHRDLYGCDPICYRMGPPEAAR